MNKHIIAVFPPTELYIYIYFCYLLLGHLDDNQPTNKKNGGARMFSQHPGRKSPWASDLTSCSA